MSPAVVRSRWPAGVGALGCPCAAGELAAEWVAGAQACRPASPRAAAWGLHDRHMGFISSA